MTDEALTRIAEALERISPPAAETPDFSAADAFVWHVSPDRLQPVPKVNRVDLSLLLGINRARDILLENTRQFSRGLPANNALLWGARGMGKSSLVKAIHADVVARGEKLKIVEVQREDLASIGRLLNILRGTDTRFLLFCDDLSFSHDDEHYKSLKAVLDGGIEGRLADGSLERDVENPMRRSLRIDRRQVAGGIAGHVDELVGRRLHESEGALDVQMLEGLGAIDGGIAGHEPGHRVAGTVGDPDVASGVGDGALGIQDRGFVVAIGRDDGAVAPKP